MSRALVLFVRENCHLCEQFLLDFSLDFPETVATLRLCDVDADPAQAAQYGLRVPVLLVAGRAVCEGSYDSEEVRSALAL